MDKIIEKIAENKLYISIIIIIIGIISYQIIKRTINRFLEKDQKRQKLDQKSRTVFNLIINVVKYLIIIIVIALILRVHGVNVSSLVAGLGIVSVIAGLAIQDPLKDIITGMNIITDNYFALGDTLKIDNFEGKVIELGVRTTKVEDIKTGNILVIANRNISKVERISDELYLSVPLPYEEEILKMEEILNECAEKISTVENVYETKYLGLSKFADSAIIYKMKIMCKPEFKFQVERDANRIIKLELDNRGISIPYSQVDVNIKK